jgi:hypothetical protein
MRRDTTKKRVMFIGHDKAIFKKFLCFLLAGQKGEHPLRPRDKGAGVMISSLICREYGLIHELN